VSKLTAKVAIVTGGGRGIGRGVARALAAEGASIVIAGRTEQTGRAAADEIERDFADRGARAVYVRTDVGEPDSVRAMVEAAARELGPADILVNNATPASGMARLEKMTPEAMDEHLRVNYYGAFTAMQAVFPAMKERGYGRIINMCSLNGINAHRYTAMYNGSKEALRALTRTAAVEWAQWGITCNAICPAAVTDPWEAFVRFDPDGAQQVLDGNPMRRLGDAESDIGPLVVFLASADSGYITGNTIHADGGGHVSGVPWPFEAP
jgi:NAD(P)-dependent dehydrogenase (short-subunit alcohol dehydrogenase family)